MVTNSCATHALVSILLNCPHKTLGSTLDRLKEHTLGMNPQNKARNHTLMVKSKEQILWNMIATASLFNIYRVGLLETALSSLVLIIHTRP